MTRAPLRVIALTLLAVLFAALPPAASSAAEPSPSPRRVVATVGMVADIVAEVAGERAVVRGLMGPGVDPHLYKPTRDDVAALMGADVVFYCGLLLEGKMSDTLVRVARTRPVIAVTERIDEALLLQPEEQAGHYDPHVWMDASAWARCVDVVADALSDHDPAGAATYRANAEALKAEMLRLHEYGVRVMASVPERHRILITSHDAFNYFGRAYGLRVLGVQGISTESEAGLARINELVDFIVAEDVRAVFVETSVSAKSVQALIEGVRARGRELAIGGTLFSDAMGERGTYEGTYLGMLDHNLTTVARALGGEAPERGLNGRLTP